MREGVFIQVNFGNGLIVMGSKFGNTVKKVCKQTRLFCFLCKSGDFLTKAVE